MTETTSTETSAIDYRRRGWSAIPLKIRSKEPKLAKGHPFLRRKPTEEEFERFDFRHNVGIVTGKVSGIAVLDDDDDGQTLKEKGWHVPPTPTVRTRRGHQHFFRCPADGFPTCDLEEKVEVRGDGAFVVAPPSIHPEGDPYRWVIRPDEVDLAELPAWIVEAAAKGKGSHNDPIDMAEVLEGVGEGERDKALFRTSAKLRGADVPYAFARKLILEAAANCTPPFPEREAIKKVDSAYSRYEATKNGHSRSHSRKDREREESGIKNPKNSLRAVSFTGKTKPPPRQFVVEGIVPAGASSIVYGPSGIAKSFNILHLALTVAFVGIDEWHGRRIMTCPVIYLDFEMDSEEQLRRAQEVARGAGWPDVPTNFWYVDAIGHSTAEVFDFAIEQLGDLGEALVVVDSFGFALAGESERSADVLAFMREQVGALRAAGGHALIVDHVARLVRGERSGNQDAFGSIYKKNAARSNIHVTGHQEEGSNEVYTTFTQKNTNLGPRVPPFTVVTKFAADEVAFELSDEVIRPPAPESTAEVIIAGIEEHGAMTNKEIAGTIDRPYKTVSNITKELKDAGALRPTGEKRDGAEILDLGGEQ